MNLYLVETKIILAYVVAKDWSEAADTVVKWLNEYDYGFHSERFVRNISLVAPLPQEPVGQKVMLFVGGRDEEEG